MSEKGCEHIHVGELIYDEYFPEKGLSIVIEASPYVQTADVLDSTDSAGGLQLGLPGTFTGYAKTVATVPLESVAEGLVNSSGIFAILGYDFVLNSLCQAALKNPRARAQ